MKQKSIRILSWLVLAIVSMPLSAVAEGDGAESGQPSRRLRHFEGQALYAIEAGYRCTGPGPGASAIASWRGKIEVRDGQVIDWGDRCNNEGLPAVMKDVTVGFWGRSIRYRGLVYRPNRDIEHTLRSGK